MKRFLATSLLVLLLVGKTMACGWGPTHNYYLFSVYNRALMQNQFIDRINSNWDAYTNGEVKEYDHDKLLAFAKRKGDTQMAEYLTLLDSYLNICERQGETWNYPTEEEKMNMDAKLKNIRQVTSQKLKTRLRSQNALLYMRANMLLGRHADNIAFWTSTVADQYPNSVYKDMMKDIYAGALVKQGRRDEALDIYAELNDMESVRWCMWDIWDLKGISKLYAESPNSPALPYLVQEFVNDSQETLDQSKWNDDGVSSEYKKEVTDFIALAERVVVEGKTKTPALWKAASAWLEFMFGNKQLAETKSKKALEMEGTERMHDNARVIRLFITASNAIDSPSFDDFLCNEMQWLTEKAKEESTDGEWNTYWSYNHYSEVFDRMVFQPITTHYKKAHRNEIATAFFSLIDPPSSELENVGSVYSSNFYSHLNYGDVNDALAYQSFIQGKPKGNLEKWLHERAYKSEDFMNDFVGTKYMALGDWPTAIKFLEKVPLAFLNQQNINPYMGSRSYSVEPWRNFQRESSWTDEPKVTLTSNKKIEFAREMIDLETKLAIANKEAAAKLAYEYAIRNYQASYKGDCWFLTHYASSTYDTLRVGEKDFLACCERYLQKAAESKDFQMKEKAYYGLAFIPTEPWRKGKWDSSSNDWVYETNPASTQYKALKRLVDLERSNPGKTAEYVSKCDVVIQFRKQYQ